MMENFESAKPRELTVQMTGRDGMPRSKKLLFTPERTGRVSGGELKHGLLEVFGEASPVMEADALTDENRSYHLVGFDDAGQGTTFADGDSIEMDRYSRFEITPRTTGGLNPLP